MTASSMNKTVVGRVVSMWRYPVKSMLGEELNSSHVTERGLLGDRAYALIDQGTGKVASAKNPRKWGMLFDFRAAFIDSPQIIGNIPRLRIIFPDGTQIFADQDDVHSALSRVLGLSCYLIYNGLYFSAISVSQDMTLRQSIRKSVMEQSKLLDSIGTAEMQRKVQKQVLTVAKKTSAAMEEKSGAEASMNEGEMKDYVELVINELRSNRVT
ncbi:MAG TPA: MOSC N-terminal beta barrel domain-containing protein [Nitrososphaeraceae archaeon]